MTRKTDRLEVLAHDLASRYGEADALVQSVRAALPQARVPAPASTEPRSTERRVHAQGPLARSKHAQMQSA